MIRRTMSILGLAALVLVGLGMLFNGSVNLLGVAAFGPKREEREFFCFAERT